MQVENLKSQLNTYVYEYVIKLGLHDVARTLARENDKFKIRTQPKSSPGRKKDQEMNGVEGDGMVLDMRMDIPDDLPRPNVPESQAGGNGFLFEWFSIFSDIFNAHSKRVNSGPASQYLMHHQVSTAFCGGMVKLISSRACNGEWRVQLTPILCGLVGWLLINMPICEPTCRMAWSMAICKEM